VTPSRPRPRPAHRRPEPNVKPSVPLSSPCRESPAENQLSLLFACYCAGHSGSVNLLVGDVISFQLVPPSELLLNCIYYYVDSCIVLFTKLTLVLFNNNIIFP